MPSCRIASMEMQSVRLYSLSGAGLVQSKAVKERLMGLWPHDHQGVG